MALNTVRASIPPAISSGKLWALQFFGNAVLFVIFLFFLQVLQESSAVQLILQIFVVLIFLAGFLILQGGTLAFMRDRHAGKPAVGSALRSAAHHVFVLFVVLLIFVAIWWIVGMLGDYKDLFPAYLRSKFPAGLRAHITEGFLDSAYAWFVGILMWLVVPALALPFAATAATQGYHTFGRAGFGAFKRAIKNWQYWLTLAVAAIIGVWLTGALMDWKLGRGEVSAEFWSVGFRLLLAYLLGIFGWLLAASVTGRSVQEPAQPAA